MPPAVVDPLGEILRDTAGHRIELRRNEVLERLGRVPVQGRLRPNEPLLCRLRVSPRHERLLEDGRVERQDDAERQADPDRQASDDPENSFAPASRSYQYRTPRYKNVNTTMKYVW